jgi:uncharacterized coiled-coil DUF342 family protein
LGSPLGTAGYNLSKIFVEQLPIIIPSKKEQKPLIDLSIEIITKNKELHAEIESFHRYLRNNYNVTKINNKLTEYYNLSYDDFYEEVKKRYKEISRKESDKLIDEYVSSIEIIKPLKTRIISIDKRINELVYQLYGLNDDEITIIENNL